MARNRTIIKPTPEEVFEIAARNFMEMTCRAIEKRGHALVVLSGGSTPQGLFELLRQPPFVNEIAWQQMHIFWADERCVPADDPQSNYGQALQQLLTHVEIPPENIHPINGSLEPAEAARQYERELRRFAHPGQQFPVFDWVLLGMGADGHTASLFPGQPEPADPMRLAFAVTAQYEGRPASRVSLTSSVINHALRIAFLVTGASKADALKKVLQGEQLPLQLPAQRIQPTGGVVTWFIDQAAASQLS